MVYEKLSQESNDESSSEAVDDTFTNLRNVSRITIIKRAFRRHWALTSHVTLVLAQAVLFAWLLSHSTSRPARTATVQYGRNYEYMTLDHEYDALWAGKAIDTGGYIVLNEHGGRYTDVEYGAISM